MESTESNNRHFDDTFVKCLGNNFARTDIKAEMEFGKCNRE